MESNDLCLWLTDNEGEFGLFHDYSRASISQLQLVDSSSIIIPTTLI